ncbi:hypothetical protein K7432_006199 [Basidiobolus ranarum]|uniref:Carbonic anhydrase n=1 Tax=Basidiobolus ranarum TaxID=34480 RepID=A0ABR2W2W7_9FUNG
MLNAYHPESAVHDCQAKKACLSSLLQKNREWSASIQALQKDFFIKSAQGQTPGILWFGKIKLGDRIMMMSETSTFDKLGCSDSRVPPEMIVQCDPGDMFVHRNIANVCLSEDLNCMSVIQYAVEVLKVKHVIVCGHYGCGGVRAAIENHSYGLIDNWLDRIKDMISGSKHLKNIKDAQLYEDLVVELNVAKSIHNITQTSFFQKAWQNGQSLSIHGFCYDLRSGILNDLDMDFDNHNQTMPPEQIKHLLGRKSSVKH